MDCWNQIEKIRGAPLEGKLRAARGGPAAFSTLIPGRLGWAQESPLPSPLSACQGTGPVGSGDVSRVRKDGVGGSEKMLREKLSKYVCRVD